MRFSQKFRIRGHFNNQTEKVSFPKHVSNTPKIKKIQEQLASLISKTRILFVKNWEKIRKKRKLGALEPCIRKFN